MNGEKCSFYALLVKIGEVHEKQCVEWPWLAEFVYCHNQRHLIVIQ